MTDEIKNKLLNMPMMDSDTGGKIFFEQYKLYIVTMEHISERRHNANSFFLTANTIIITTLTGVFSLTQEFLTSSGWLILPIIVGILFCFSWNRLILSYKQLSSGKFVIIHLLEEHLPVRLFDAEWDVLQKGRGTAYKQFTQTERLIPFIFIGLYILLSLLVVVELLK